MSFLTRKYPYPIKNDGSGIKECLIYAAIVVFILYFLQPFGISEFQGNKFLFSLLFGLVTFVCTLFFIYVVLYPMMRRAKTWRIWHHVLAIIALNLFIGSCNFFTIIILFKLPIMLGYLFRFLYWTLLIGTIIAVISTARNYQHHLRNRLEILLDKNTDEQEDIMVTIHDSRVRGNDIHIRINDLLYVEAQKNYVNVFHVEDGRMACSEIQATMAAVLKELEEYPNVFQCHRSFAVNVNNITNARGNSNGYTLTLGDNLATVPVSRAFVPKLKSFIA